MANQGKTKLVAIVDDDDSMRSALQGLMKVQGFPAHAYASAEEFLKSGQQHQTACLIADIRMPGMSGLELQAKLKSERCPLPIIFITARGDIPMAVRAIQGGAIDFLTKPIDEAAFFNSVEKAFEQERANRREATEQEAFAAQYATLTPREREVLALLVRGLLNKQAAFELGITEYTVQIHRAHIMRKMEADTFATLVRRTARFVHCS